MSNLEKYSNQGLIFSLYLIAITFPFSYKLSNPWIVLMFVFWLLNRIAKRRFLGFAEWTKWDKVSFISLISFFLWHTASLIFTNDFNNGLKGLEGKLSFLVFPLVLYSIKLEPKQLWKILQVYTISISLATVYLLTNSGFNYLNTGAWLTYHDFTGPFSAHAVFYSYYLFLSILISISLITNEKVNGISRVLYIVMIFISLAGLVFSASKNVTLVSIFFGVLLLLGRYANRGLKWKEVAGISLIAIVTLSIASQIPSVQNRMGELFSNSGMKTHERIVEGYSIFEEDNHAFNGTSLRLTFWYLGVTELIDRDRLWVGLTPGDRKAQMNQRYLRVGLRPYQNYNLHNQFIQVLVELGIIGLFIYLMIYISLIASASSTSNKLLLIFLIATLIFQLTESILERNKSIVFFLFFLCLLQHLTKKRQYENRHLGN